MQRKFAIVLLSFYYDILCNYNFLFLIYNIFARHLDSLFLINNSKGKTSCRFVINDAGVRVPT